MRESVSCSGHFGGWLRNESVAPLIRRQGVVQHVWCEAVAHWGDRLPILREAALDLAPGETSMQLSLFLWFGVKNWKPRPPSLLALACLSQVGFMTATFASTSEIEQQFSTVQMLSSGRKARTSLSHLKSMLKVRLNGVFLAAAVFLCKWFVSEGSCHMLQQLAWGPKVCSHRISSHATERITPPCACMFPASIVPGHSGRSFGLTATVRTC